MLQVNIVSGFVRCLRCAFPQVALYVPSFIMRNTDEHPLAVNTEALIQDDIANSSNSESSGGVSEVLAIGIICLMDWEHVNTPNTDTNTPQYYQTLFSSSSSLLASSNIPTVDTHIAWNVLKLKDELSDLETVLSSSK